MKMGKKQHSYAVGFDEGSGKRKHIEHKIAHEEFFKHCQFYTVLPDFYKFWAMNLNLVNRGESWKLDFNSEGWIAQNFTPHGTPAIRKDTLGTRRFVVWNRYELAV